MKEEQSLDSIMIGLVFDYACRALLGGGKGVYVMLQLYERSPELYRGFIEAARKFLADKPGIDLEELDERYRQLQMIVGDLEKERSN